MRISAEFRKLSVGDIHRDTQDTADDVRRLYYFVEISKLGHKTYCTRNLYYY
jgi:hypothetical protein